MDLYLKGQGFRVQGGLGFREEGLGLLSPKSHLQA